MTEALLLAADTALCVAERRADSKTCDRHKSRRTPSLVRQSYADFGTDKSCGFYIAPRPAIEPETVNIGDKRHA